MIVWNLLTSLNKNLETIQARDFVEIELNVNKENNV